jgi:hypothetical protein
VSGGEEIATRRTLLLERTAASVGETWARGWLAELGSEGRSAAGGWPGTITQARSRVRVMVTAELARARFQPAAADEVDKTARAAYARAREVWLASAKADDADDDDPSDDDAPPQSAHAAGSVNGARRGHHPREGAP